MAVNLLTIPRLTVRAGVRAAGLVWNVAGRAVHVFDRGAAQGRSAAAPPPPPAAAAPAQPPAAAAAPARPAPAPPVPAPPPPRPEPEPDVLVAESADPGAEDGAGAELHIAEPWPGYDGMTAPAINDRLVVADSATLGAVKLYESAHRKRRTVIAAAEAGLARS